MATARLRLWLALAGLAVLVILVIDSTGVISDHYSVVVDDSAQLVAALLAAVACFWTASRVRGIERRWRLLMGLGVFGWAIGQAIWSFYQVFSRIGLPSPSLADAGYLTLPVFAFFALLAIAADGLRQYRHGGLSVVSSRYLVRDETTEAGGERVAVRSWLVLALDGMVVVGSMLILTWTSALGAVVDSGAPTWQAFAVAIAYPVTDLILLVMVILLLALWPLPPRLRPQLLLLGLGVVGLSVSDSIFAYIVAKGGDSMPPIADAGFIIGPVLIGMAALTYAKAAQEPARPPARRFEWGHLLLPYLPLAATQAVIAIRTITGSRVSPLVVYVAVIVIIFVVIRQMITLADNQALLDRVIRAQERLSYQASHDSLTGLPNRATFWERLAEAIERARRGERRFILFFIDIDNFKEINDNHGHGAGDDVLREVSRRLQSRVRRDDMIARLGGDEFGALIEDGTEWPDQVGERLRAAFDGQFIVDDGPIEVTASVGATVIDGREPGLTADALLNRADAAMYAGKRRGPGRVVTQEVVPTGGYDEEALPVMLTNALTGDPAVAGLDVHYQPIVGLSDGCVRAVEALARWTHPTVGPIPADVFVSVAERVGMIGKLDDFVLDRACHDLARHQAARGALISVHVNVSGGRFGGAAVETSVRDHLAKYALDPRQLVLEITESAHLGDLAQAASSAVRLRERGIRLALDDFGTGYNSLSLLYDLPLDAIKMDRRLTVFDTPGANGASPESLCQAVASLAAQMGLMVVAEGVETAHQSLRLERMGVCCGQGDWFGRPQPFHGTFPAGPLAGVSPVGRNSDSPDP